MGLVPRILLGEGQGIHEKEKFVPAGCTKGERDQRISIVVRKMDLHRKAQCRLYILFMLAKAKWSAQVPARVPGCFGDFLPTQSLSYPDSSCALLPCPSHACSACYGQKLCTIFNAHSLNSCRVGCVLFHRKARVKTRGRAVAVHRHVLAGDGMGGYGVCLANVDVDADVDSDYLDGDWGLRPVGRQSGGVCGISALIASRPKPKPKAPATSSTGVPTQPHPPDPRDAFAEALGVISPALNRQGFQIREITEPTPRVCHRTRRRTTNTQ